MDILTKEQIEKKKIEIDNFLYNLDRTIPYINQGQRHIEIKKIFEKYKNYPDSYETFYFESLPYAFKLQKEPMMNMKYLFTIAIDKIIHLFPSPDTLASLQNFINENEIDVIIDIGSFTGFHSALFKSEMFQCKLNKKNTEVWAVDVKNVFPENDPFYYTTPTHTVNLDIDESYNNVVSDKITTEFAENTLTKDLDKNKKYCLFICWPRSTANYDYIYTNIFLRKVSHDKLFVIVGGYISSENIGSPNFKRLLPKRFEKSSKINCIIGWNNITIKNTLQFMEIIKNPSEILLPEFKTFIQTSLSNPESNGIVINGDKLYRLADELSFYKVKQPTLLSANATSTNANLAGGFNRLRYRSQNRLQNIKKNPLKSRKNKLKKSSKITKSTHKKTNTNSKIKIVDKKSIVVKCSRLLQ